MVTSSNVNYNHLRCFGFMSMSKADVHKTMPSFIENNKHNGNTNLSINMWTIIILSLAVQNKLASNRLASGGFCIAINASPGYDWSILFPAMKCNTNTKSIYIFIWLTYRLEGMFLFDKDVRWHRDKMADANFQTFEGSSCENPWKPRRSRLPWQISNEHAQISWPHSNWVSTTTSK